MTNSITNRHGDTIRIGQLWADDRRRTAQRTLRIDDVIFDGVNDQAVCTVLYAHDTETGETTEPGRVIRIKVDSLHTTTAGNGYRRIHSARQAGPAAMRHYHDKLAWPYRNVVVFCDRCGGEAEADMLASYREQAFAGLRAICNDNGWLCTDRGDWCPNCAPAGTR